MKAQVMKVELDGTPDEIRETLKSLGIGSEQVASKVQNGNDIQHGKNGLGWNEAKARAFLKALDEYKHLKPLFYTVWTATGTPPLAYADLLNALHLNGKQLAGKLAAITKLARRNGNKGAWAIWYDNSGTNYEVDPELRKVIEEANLMHSFTA